MTRDPEVRANDARVQAALRSRGIRPSLAAAERLARDHGYPPMKLRTTEQQWRVDQLRAGIVVIFRANISDLVFLNDAVPGLNAQVGDLIEQQPDGSVERYASGPHLEEFETASGEVLTRMTTGKIITDNVGR